MVCSHLRELYELCENNELRLSSSDLVRVVCKKCEEVETCPSTLMDEYDSLQQDGAASSANDNQSGSTNDDAV